MYSFNCRVDKTNERLVNWKTDLKKLQYDTKKQGDWKQKWALAI